MESKSLAIIIVVLVFCTLCTVTIEEPPPKPEKEISIDELYQIFGPESTLTGLQKEEQFKELQRTRIISSIRVDRLNEATISGYVAFQEKSEGECLSKAFFRTSEKDRLLKVNTGDTLVFSGNLYSTEFGWVSCITFTDAKVIKIGPGSAAGTTIKHPTPSRLSPTPFVPHLIGDCAAYPSGSEQAECIKDYAINKKSNESLCYYIGDKFLDTRYECLKVFAQRQHTLEACLSLNVSKYQQNCIESLILHELSSGADSTLLRVLRPI